MTERRRSSTTTILVGIMAAYAQAAPLELKGRSCSDTSALAALQQTVVDVEGFCRAFAPEAAPTVTQAITTTVTEGEDVTILTVTATPTISFHINADVMVTSTLTTQCAQATIAPADGVKAASQAATPTPTPPAKIAPIGLPVSQGRVAGSGGNVVHARDVNIPAYMAGFDTEQIQAGCECFMADKATAEEQTITVTRTIIPTSTKHWTTMAEHAYISMVHDGNAKTATVTHCA